MGKRTSQLTQLTAAQVAQGDFLPIVDVSAGQTKYVTVKDLTGLPDTGWLATGESWAYSSWNSTTRIGVVTVPTDATTKYANGMRVRISQTTGGTKYAIIHAVTTTTLTLFFGSGTTLNNEAINSPVYSPLDTPFGFSKDPATWSLESVNATDSTQSAPTLGTWYNPGSHSLTFGPGAWKVYGKNTHGADRAAAGRTDHSNTLSTSSSSESHTRFTTGNAGNNVTFTSSTSIINDDLVVAATTTLYSLVKANGTGINNLFLFGTGNTVGGSRLIKVTSAYL